MGQQSGLVCRSALFVILLFSTDGPTAWGQVRPRVVEAVNNATSGTSALSYIPEIPWNHELVAD